MTFSVGQLVRCIDGRQGDSPVTNGTVYLVEGCKEDRDGVYSGSFVSVRCDNGQSHWCYASRFVAEVSSVSSDEAAKEYYEIVSLQDLYQP
jgi:hypothetical protein